MRFLLREAACQKIGPVIQLENRGFDALAVSGSKLTVWRLSPGTTAWTTTQVINVPIEYGSS